MLSENHNGHQLKEIFFCHFLHGFEELCLNQYISLFLVIWKTLLKSYEFWSILAHI